VTYWPGAQTVAAAQLYELIAVENVSAAQSLHTRSLLVVRLAVTNSPALHVLAATQPYEFCTAENVPAGQAAHARLLLSVRLAVMYSPALQLVAAMQPLWLPAGWYEFAPQALQSRELAAGELLPAGQSLQARLLLPVRLAVMYWPAAQTRAASHP